MYKSSMLTVSPVALRGSQAEGMLEPPLWWSLWLTGCCLNTISIYGCHAVTVIRKQLSRTVVLKLDCKLGLPGDLP